MPPELRLKANAFSGARALNAAVLATEQQIEKIREDQKKSFIHSLTFKIITFGIGIKISNSQKETDERRINELKDGVKALYRRLDDAIRLKNEKENRTFTSGDFSVQMVDEAVHFRMEEDGRLFARMADNPDEKEYALTASVEDLRYKLAEDMFSHPDLFDRKDLKDMLPVPTKRENRQQQLSTEGTYERHVFMLAIKSRSNIGGASLENVTTANLRDLAQAALDTDGDADAVTEELKKRLETINQTISANRLTTVEAETMVEAFRAQTDEVKQTITVAPTMEKAPPPSKAAHPIPPAYREFLADLFSAGFNEDTSDVQAVMDVMIRHSETLSVMLRDPDALNQLCSSLRADEANPMNQNFAEALEQMGKLLNDFKTIFSSLKEEASGKNIEDCIRRGFDETYTDEQRNLSFAQKGSLFLFSGKVKLLALEIKNRVPDQVMAQVTEMMNEKMNEIFKAATGGDTWNQATTIDAMLESAKASAVKGGHLKFVQTTLKNYFNDAEPQDKRAMVAAAIRYGKDDDSEIGMFGAMLKGAGPLLQKMMQGLDYFTEEFRPIFMDVKKNLAPIDHEQIQAYLLDIKNRSGGKIDTIEAKQNLGAASVGEVVDCIVKGKGYPPEGKALAVKLLRPDALVRIGRERDKMLAYARECDMEEPYKAQLETIMGEFDFTDEAENIRKGEIYNKGSKRVHSVRIDSTVEATPSTLAMEKAPGRTAAEVIEDAHQKIAELKILAATNPKEAETQLKNLYNDLMIMHDDLCTFAKQWLTEGIFGSGFAHGDLHRANITLDLINGLTVLDFGNVTKLTEEQQSNITRVMAAAAVGQKAVQFFIDGFRELLSEDGRTKFDTMENDVRTLLVKVLSAGREEDAGARIFIILSKLQEMGVPIPGPIYAFSQSENRLEATINGMTSVIDELRETLFSFPNAYLNGPKEERNVLFDSLTKEFVEAVEVEGKIRHDAFHIPLDQKYRNLFEGYSDKNEDALMRRGRISTQLQISEAEDKAIKNTITFFRKMGVPNIEDLEKDYNEYLPTLTLSNKQFSDISYNAFKPLRSSVLTEDLRKKFITDDAIKSDADKKRYKQAFEELWGELEDFGKVRKELGETVFPDYLKKLMEAADKKNDVDVKGSIAYFKARICHYLFDTADGRQRVDEANRNLRTEWAKVVEAEGRIGELHVRVQNEFEKADLACLKKVRDENKRLGKVLPKRRPRSFIDCMSDVLKQNALATVNRVDKGLILLHQMA